MQRKQLDELWKGVLENTFEDFLRFVNPGVDAILDFKRGIVFLDKELDLSFGNMTPAPKIVDKLARVYTLSGEEEYILVHVEVQEQYRQDFSKRMFEYYYRIFDKYQKPITAYAIFLENNLIERPDFFEQNCLGTSLKYRYNTYKIANQSYESLLSEKNPFAMAVLTAKSALMLGTVNDGERDLRLMEYKRQLVRVMLSSGIAKEKIEALLYFLRFYISFENIDYSIKFDNELKLLTSEKNISMGIEEQVIEILKREAIEEGLEQGRELGLEQGREQGRELGLEQGREQGLEQGRELGLEQGREIGFQQGQQVGLKKAKDQEILRLIQTFAFSIEKAAEFADVPLAYVKEVLLEKTNEIS